MPDAVDIVSLGGAGGFGMNATLLAQGDASLLVDFGVGFPHPGLPGVARLVPGADAAAARFPRPAAIVLTHGHDDHVGALPWLPAPWRDVPHIGRALTLALVRDRYEDAGSAPPELRELRPGRATRIGPFDLEVVPVNHSIPHSTAAVIGTSAGRVVVSGDLRFDETPHRAELTDEARLREIGDDGVRALLLDSTGALRDAPAGSESGVAREMARVAREATGQVFVSHFSSHVERLQAVLDAARASGRRAALLGRRLARTFSHATDFGLIDVPAGLVLRSEDLAALPPRERLWVAGGCQGERGSSLSRLSSARSSHAAVSPGDTVVISARVIPGNAVVAARLVDRFLRLGAHVLHADRHPALHVSGHGGRPELRRMIRLMRPAAVVPQHGDLRNLVAAADLARDEAVADAPVAESGEVLRIPPEGPVVRLEPVDVSPRLLDGSGVPLDADALRDRRVLAEAGVAIVVLGRDGGAPDVVLRGVAGDGDGSRTALCVEAARRALGGRGSESRVERVARAVRAALRRTARRIPLVVVTHRGGR